MIGSIVGAAMSVGLAACFAQDRVLFLGSLALWAAICTLVATLLRNFGSYSAALSGYTAAIIAGDLLGTVGGLDANAAFLLAITRASEVCLGIACAGIVLAGTDFGGARRRLAARLEDLTVAITAGLAQTMAMADAPTARRELVRRVIELDPIIDQTIGESGQIRYRSPVLQAAVDGLFSALAGWHAFASHLVELPRKEARQEAEIVRENVPQKLQPEPRTAQRWLVEPVVLQETSQMAAAVLDILPVSTPSLRLLADKAAEAFTGLARTFDGLVLLVDGPEGRASARGGKRLHVADWLPALVNAGRTLAVVGAVALFWMVTGWPGGSAAITFATIIAVLLAPRADQAFGAAVVFAIGIVLDLVLTAIVGFVLLPTLATETFIAFSLVIGACLLPIGTLLARARQPWQVGMFTAMTMLFVPLLQPTNPMTYDLTVFYNTALAVVPSAIFAALSFRLLPPLSPAFRARRLLNLTLRDLRRLAAGRSHSDWVGHVADRLAVMPGEATPLQRTQLLAALLVGSEIIRLRRISRDLNLGAPLDAAFKALAEGQSETATTHLHRIDAALADSDDGAPKELWILRARASILALKEALSRHTAYFDAEAPR